MARPSARSTSIDPEIPQSALQAVIGGPYEPTSLGPDIDDANAVLLDPAIHDGIKIERLRRWASRHQPCMFGRLGSKGLGGIQYDCCWINQFELRRGSRHVANKVQAARRQWKQRAIEGLSHGFLIMFNAPEFVYLKPGPRLVELCLELCDLFLIEHAPVAADTIYVESIPYMNPDGSSVCLKGGTNVFYGSAHRTSNHDRRIPGGIMISVNSPGLLANSLLKQGAATNLNDALDSVRSLAWASIGNGGHSYGKKRDNSCSWHNVDAARPPGACPMKHRPNYVPDNFDTSHYSALYHTDVLVPSKVMLDRSQDRPRSDFEVWPQLDFDYLSTAEFAPDHESFGFVHGQPVPLEQLLEHTWAPQPLPGATSKAQPT